METMFKAINCEIKDIDEEGRSFTAVASTEDLDRDNDRIMAAGWDVGNFLKNPVVPWSHRYGDPPVARAERVWVDGNRLMFTPKFATKDDYPFADTIYRLYKGGFLKAFSVGFRAKRYEIVDRGGKAGRGIDYHEAVLREVSACTVPSNPNALVEAMEKGVIDYRERIEIGKRMETGSQESMDAKRLEIEKRLDEMGAMIERINKDIEKTDEVYKRMDALIVKIDQALVTETLNDQPEQTAETLNDQTLSREDIAELAKTVSTRAAEKIAAMVEKKINYHKSIL